MPVSKVQYTIWHSQEEHTAWIDAQLRLGYPSLAAAIRAAMFRLTLEKPKQP